MDKCDLYTDWSDLNYFYHWHSESWLNKYFCWFDMVIQVDLKGFFMLTIIKLKIRNINIYLKNKSILSDFFIVFCILNNITS